MTVITPNRMLVEVESNRQCGERQTHWISEPSGLTQFGALVQVLPRGARTSIKHWHSAEDELVYVLDGDVTLVEGNTEMLLAPGDAAAFPAGVAVGHFLENRSVADVRILVVGTRSPVDAITCPDHDRICHRDRALPHDIWTDMDGQPADNPHTD